MLCESIVYYGQNPHEITLKWVWKAVEDEKNVAAYDMLHDWRDEYLW